MTRRLAFEPAARENYLALRKDPDSLLYLAVREVLTGLLESPGSRRLRELLYRPNTWGAPIRCGDVRWLVLWRLSGGDPDLIEVHYVGPAAGESQVPGRAECLARADDARWQDHPDLLVRLVVTV